MFFLCKETTFKEEKGQVTLSKIDQRVIQERPPWPGAQILQGIVAFSHITTKRSIWPSTLKRGKVIGINHH